MMGMGEGISWVNHCGKKQCMNLFRRMKAAVKKAAKKKNGGGSHRGKQKSKFHYDPSSYALNFDDCCYDMGEKGRDIFDQHYHQQNRTDSKLHNPFKTATLIYIIWVES